MPIHCRMVAGAEFSKRNMTSDMRGDRMGVYFLALTQQKQY